MYKDFENFIKCLPKRFDYFLNNSEPFNWWSEKACKNHYKQKKRKKRKEKKEKRKQNLVFQCFCFIN